jgi:diaminopimelate dehydrogenase
MKIGILGYRNLGKGVEQAIRYNKDMEFAGVFTRRDPSTITTITKNIPVYHIDIAPAYLSDKSGEELRRKLI